MLCQHALLLDKETGNFPRKGFLGFLQPKQMRL